MGRKIDLKQISKLEPDVIEEIVDVTLQSQHVSKLQTGSSVRKDKAPSRNMISDYIKRLTGRPKLFVALAYVDKELKSWLAMSTGGTYPSIFAYHPLVTDDWIDSDLPHEILKQTLGFAKKHDIARLGITLRLGEDYTGANELYGTWYEHHRFVVGGESVSMKLLASDCKNVGDDLPEGFTISPVIELEEDKLYQCYQETFRKSQDRWNLNLTEEERREQFAYNLGAAKKSSCPDASLGLVHKREIAGFSFAETDGEHSAYINDFGIHPTCRMKGIGTSLLGLTANRLFDCDLKVVTLESDVQNVAALKVYEAIGFTEVSKTRRYELRF